MTIGQSDTQAGALVASDPLDVSGSSRRATAKIPLANFRRQVLAEVQAARRQLIPTAEQSASEILFAGGGVLLDGRPAVAPEEAPDTEAVLARGFSLAALRYFALTAHPLADWNFSWNGLEAAEAARETLVRRVQVAESFEADFTAAALALRRQFLEALADGLDTPAALEIFWRVVRADLPPAERRALVLDFDRLLGLDLTGGLCPAAGELPAGAQSLIEQREAARGQKDWTRSDELRDRLGALGVETRDSPGGSTYHRRERDSR